MTFRGRVVLFSALAVTAAVAIASLLVYFLVRDELRDGVDAELRADVSGPFALPIVGAGNPDPVVIGAGGRPAETNGTRSRRRPSGAGRPRDARGTRSGAVSRQARRLVLPTGPLGGPTVYAQLVDADGELIRPRGGGLTLPADASARVVAAGEHGPYFTDLEAGGAHVRVYTAQVEPGQAIQVARPLDDVDDTLARLALILGLVSLGSVGIAVGLGVVVSRTALSPVARLNRAAHEVAATRDLTRRIDPSGGGELDGLARSFNSMLTALEGSLRAQRQLVADASHELRTPLASLRTNIEVLAHSEHMPESQREGLLADVIAQLDELTVLVGDLVDLARGAEQGTEPQVPVRLDLLADDTVERVRSRAHGVEIRLDAAPCTVRGVERRLERALTNLLDNAVKWSPPGAAVEVGVAGGTVAVRDRGPGIDAADLPHVFDRFYRSAAARGMPGSGLGLAIVRQVAEAHGGSVEAAAAPGGGTILRLRLPAVDPAGAGERASARAAALT